jgi:hypothetical protein
MSSEISGRKYSPTVPHKTLVILKANVMFGGMLFSIKQAPAQSGKQLLKDKFFWSSNYGS